MQVYLAFLPLTESLSGSWLNRKVAQMAGEPDACVHAEIVWREDPEDLYCLACSIRYGGTVFVQDRLFQRKGWRFRQLSVDPAKGQALLDWCRRVEGERFNYLGFYGRSIPCLRACLPRPRGRWFCSELVAACLRENGVMDIQTCTPHELYKQILFRTCPAHPKVKHLPLVL